MNEETIGLPRELVKQLRRVGFNPESVYTKLVKILSSTKDSWTLDQLLIEYWKKHKDILERQKMNSMLNSLVQKKQIKRVFPGVYKA